MLNNNILTWHSTYNYLVRTFIWYVHLFVVGNDRSTSELVHHIIIMWVI